MELEEFFLSYEMCTLLTTLAQNFILLTVKWVGKSDLRNSSKILLQLVIVYQHSVLTGEKKEASYLWIFSYT